jgi:hypothetical protein
MFNFTSNYKSIQNHIMKKRFSVLLMIGLVSSVALTSCTEEEEEDPTPNPTVYGDINAYSARMVGGQNNASLGSFLATDSGSVITSGAAGASTALQARVDLVYFFGTTNGASMGAPKDSVVAIAHTGSTTLPAWTTKNDTRLMATTLTPAQFIASNNDSLVKAVTTGVTMNATLANQLTVGKVVAFKTAGGKFGLFHVASITGTTGTDRAITVDVKVQK